MPASTPLRPLVDALEQTAVLDAPAKALGKRVREVVPAGAVKDAISGTWFGHAVHPPLTDLVIGSFVSATVLDLIAPDSDQASERLIGLGLLAAAPTALTGVNDWSDSEAADDGIRRVGLVHAAGNVTALCLYAASLAARRRGATGRGRALAAAGAAVLSAGGYLGGHMSFTRGVGPNQTAFDPGPDEWTEVVGAGEAREGQPASGVASDTPVLLIRHEGQLHALHDRCSHRGCSLSEGELDGNVITCSCHGSQFDVTDGSVIRGPATAGQPVLEAREGEGHVEVRLQRRG